jgi:bifunctional enzyme CysN/CysC/sulfate adenylyltransferase subunit 1
MDLVGFEEARYRALVAEFSEFLSRLRFQGTSFVPVSAKQGDNVVERSKRTPYYDGPTLLGLLETLPVTRDRSGDALRFPVQYVLRPHLDYRGFAGVIAEGEVKVGDEIMVLPSGRTSVVSGIDTYEGELERAFAPMSVTIRLADEVDVSRGDMLVRPGPGAAVPAVAYEVEAMVVWLSEQAFDPSRQLLMKHAARSVPARIVDVTGHLSLETLQETPRPGLKLNDIARVRVHAARPVFCDPYEVSRSTGAFILIDRASNGTVAAGMIRTAKGIERSGNRRRAVSQDERKDRLGHRALLVRVDAADPRAIERMLFDRGLVTLVVSAGEVPTEAIELLTVRAIEAGLVVLSAGLDDATFRAIAAKVPGAPIVDATNAPDLEGIATRIATEALAIDVVAGGGGI